MYKVLNETNNTERNKTQVDLIKSALTDLKKDTENTSKGDVNKIEENDKVMDIVEHIIYFNDQDKDQQGQGLKIITPSQTLSRLPISLAQLNAENNSEKLKNELRQLLYSLYR